MKKNFLSVEAINAMFAVERKMNFLLKKYFGIDGESCEYLIHKTGFSHGTIMVPTGGGKSAISYEDAIWHIDHRVEGQKLIINFACPILKLEEQYLKDLFEGIVEIYKDNIANGEFMFFVNSSEDTSHYAESLNGIPCMSFSEIEKFKNSKNAKVAFVASCHRSMDKFVAKMDEMKKFATLITYIDEAHLINSTRLTHYHSWENQDEECERIQLEKLCECDYLYALTATPDQNVTKKINHFNRFNDANNKFIIRIEPEDLIKKGVILPPNIDFLEADEDYRLNSELIYEFMEKVRKESPNIKHKVLVNCKGVTEMRTLASALRKYGYKVFTTCYHGSHSLEDDNASEIDECKFIDEVSDYDGDCFVLHIKKLIQGIDIKSITDCIIRTAGHLDSSTAKTMVQTIGRTLRPLNGERGEELAKNGKTLDSRVKKYGRVLIITPEDYEEDMLKNFFMKYYGVNTMTFASNKKPNVKGNGVEPKLENNDPYADEFKDDEEDSPMNSFDFEKLEINVKKYVEKQVIPLYKAKDIVKFDMNEVWQSMVKRFGNLDKNYDTWSLLSETSLLGGLKDMLIKLGIKEAEAITLN